MKSSAQQLPGREKEREKDEEREGLSKTGPVRGLSRRSLCLEVHESRYGVTKKRRARKDDCRAPDAVRLLKKKGSPT